MNNLNEHQPNTPTCDTETDRGRKSKREGSRRGME